MTDSKTTAAVVSRVSGGQNEHGHLEVFRTHPIGLMKRVREECGDVGSFQLVDKHVILLSGAQAEAYPFMTPIFGKGVSSTPAPSGARRCRTTRRCAVNR